MCAKSFSRTNIIAIEKSKMFNNIIGITEDGNERHLGGLGGEIRSIVNSSGYAIISMESGQRVLFDFDNESYRNI